MEKFEEWTIENFSFWNREIHGNVITPPKSSVGPEFTIDLFPGGISGHEEHLVVILRCSEPVIFSGELSFIGLEGSLLLTQQVDSKELPTTNIILPPGPKFKEVFSEIRKNQDIQRDRLTVRWRIKRYVDTKTYRRTTLDVFSVAFRISPKIFDSKGKMISWLIYPCGEEKIGELNLSACKVETYGTKIIMLTLKPEPFKNNVLVQTRMSVLNNEDDVVRTEENEHLFRDGEKWIFVKSLTIEEGSFILHFKIIPKVKNNGYISVCHYHRDAVSLISSEKLCPAGPRVPKTHFSKNESNLSDNSLQNLSKELMRLHQDQDFSDIQLKCGDVSFPVHRNILSARSPVFHTMLSTDMIETASGTVDIRDLDPSTLSRFLAFLYTGAIEDQQGESALKLYYAADKYQVPSLKRECADFLSVNITISNVCEILSLGNMHQDDQLTSAAYDFILDNYNEVLSSEAWASFMRSEPLLAVETVTHFAKKKYVRKSEF